MAYIITFIVLWVLIVAGTIIKIQSDSHHDKEAPEEPDYSKTGWDFHEELKQRAKWNSDTISAGNKKYGQYWLSGKDPYLVVEKEVSGGRLTGADIPYTDIKSYDPYKYEHGENKNVIGRALLGSVIAGPIGGIVGAISGSGQNNSIDSLGVIVTTNEGDRYDLKTIVGPYRPERDDLHIKNYAKTIRKLDEIVNGEIN